jgi:hypothetical protein
MTARRGAKATTRPWLGPWQWAALDVLTPTGARD